MALTKVRAKIDGTWVTLTYNSATGRYEGYYTPTRTSFHQTGGYFNVTAEATNSSGATETADGTVFQGLRLVSQEIQPPTLTVVSPQPGYVTVKRPTVTMDAVDESGGSGIKPSSFTVTLDGAAQSAGKSTSAISGGYRLSWTPTAGLSEGPHLVTFGVKDNDGNSATVSAAYTVDTVPPSLWLSKPNMHRVVDTETAYVRVEAWDLTSGPPTVTVKNNGKAVPVTPAEPQGGELYDVFEAQVPLEVGENNITVTATDGAGWQTAIDVYMIRLITDRTQADVDRLKRLLERGMDKWTAQELSWFTGGILRGTYDTDDVNRVGLAVKYLKEQLQALGYDPSAVPKTDWTMLDAMTRSQGERYLDNVEIIRNAQHIDWLSELPLPEGMRWLSYIGANQIEAALVYTDLVFPFYQSWTSGEVTSGEA